MIRAEPAARGGARAEAPGRAPRTRARSSDSCSSRSSRATSVKPSWRSVVRFRRSSSLAIRSSRSSSASSWRSPTSLLRPRRPILRASSGARRGCGRRSAPRPSAREQSLERAGSGLDRRDPARGSELRERDARERLGRVREHAELALRSPASARSAALVAASRRRKTGARSSAEALEQRSPVPGSRPVERRPRRPRGPRAAPSGSTPRTRARPTSSQARQSGACRRARRGRWRGRRRAHASRRARSGLPEEDAARDPDRVDRDVDRRPVAAARRTSGGARRSRRTGPRARARAPERPVARTRSAPRIAYSAAWASLRRTRSQPPSPVPRFGTEENAKITPAQTRTGSQSRRERAGHRPMIGSPSNQEHGEGTRCESGTVPPL